MKKSNLFANVFFCVLSFFILLSHAIFAQTLTSIPGLKLWLRSDSGVTLNAGNVANWADKSGSSNDASQASAPNQPLYVLNALCGYPTVRFVDDFLTTPSIDIGQRTEFFVIKRNGFASPGGYQNLIGSTAAPYYQLYVPNADSSFHSYNGATDITHPFSFSTGYQIITRVISSNQITLYQNGVISSSFASGANSNTNQPLVIGSLTGTQNLNADISEIIIYDQALTDPNRILVEQYLRNKYAPPVNLGADTLICISAFPYTLKAKKDCFVIHLWQDGSTLDSLVINSAGSYNVKVQDVFGNISRDTINITVDSPQPFQLNDTAICPGGSLKWNTGLSHSLYTFKWQDGSTDSLFNIISAGSYYVKVTNLKGCAMTTHTVTITIDNFSTTASLGPDISLCNGNFIYLKTGAAQAASYVWSNGSTNDSLLISSIGQYSLTATSINGCIKKDTIKITSITGSVPTVAFSTDTTCLGSATQLKDLSNPPAGNSITSRIWDFGDLSSVNSISSDTSHLYADTGAYTVKLTVTTNIGCAASLSKKFKVYPYPQGSFTTANLCERDSVLYTGSATTFGYPISKWIWNFGEPASGITNIDSIQNPAHIYANAATYTVSLTIKNAYGCATIINNPVIIKPAPVTAFNYSLPCEKQMIQFTDNTTLTSPLTITGGSWNFGDGSASTPVISPIHTYSVSATYNVVHKMNASNGCSNTINKLITVHPKPTALYSTGAACISLPTIFTDTSLISGGTVANRLWTFGVGGATSSLQNAPHTFNALVSPQVKLLVTSDKGCKDSITKTITVHPVPVASFTYTPTYGSPPLAVTFASTSTGASTYAWDFDDTHSAALPNTSDTFTDSGTYHVSLTAINGFGCRDTSVKTIDVLQPLIDVAVQNITLLLQNNFMNVSVQIVNKSSMDITSLELTVKLNDGTEIQEHWTGLLLRGGVLQDTISSTIYMQDLKHFVCVSAIQPNGLADEYPADNESCVAVDLSSFEVLAPYPNPAGDYLILPLLVPAGKNLDVTLYNARGKLVRAVYSGIIPEGLQLITVDLIGLAKGFYAFTIVYDDGKTIVKRFVIE